MTGAVNPGISTRDSSAEGSFIPSWQNRQVADGIIRIGGNVYCFRGIGQKECYYRYVIAGIK